MTRLGTAEWLLQLWPEFSIAVLIIVTTISVKPCLIHDLKYPVKDEAVQNAVCWAEEHQRQEMPAPPAAAPVTGSRSENSLCH